MHGKKIETMKPL